MFHVVQTWRTTCTSRVYRRKVGLSIEPSGRGSTISFRHTSTHSATQIFAVDRGEASTVGYYQSLLTRRWFAARTRSVRSHSPSEFRFPSNHTRNTLVNLKSAKKHKT